MTVLFVAALAEETTALIDRGIVPLHVGVGKVEAATNLAHHLAAPGERPDLIVNLGTAGGLRGQRLAEVVEVATVLQHDFDRETASAFVGRELPGGPRRVAAPDGVGATLATGDRIVADPTDRERLAAVADLVDMEGYAIATVGARFGIPVRIAKAVSDGADDGAQTSWTDTLTRCSHALADWAHDQGLLPPA